MTTIDTSELFANLFCTGTEGLRRIKADNGVIGVYYGFNSSGNYRLAFLSQTQPEFIGSTASLQVIQWAENINTYWTCFDLIADKSKSVYFALDNDLIEAALSQPTDQLAMIAVKNRFFAWQKMFQKSYKKMTEETYKGLFGELFFLKTVMAKRYGLESAIKSWSGAEKTAKDFSVGEDWYEVKTVSVRALGVTISSLTQLESDVDGTLAVIKVEEMSEMYCDGESSVAELLKEILNGIQNDNLKESLINKVTRYGFNSEESGESYKHYRVSSTNLYHITNGFPRITGKDVPHKEITNVTYEIALSGIEKYREA